MVYMGVCHMIPTKSHKSCRAMIDKPPPSKGLNLRTPMIAHVKGKGFINQGLG